MEVNAANMQKVVEYVAESQPLLQKHAEVQAQVAATVPAVVDELIKQGFVDASIREKAIVNLQDPLRALDTLKKLAAAVKTSQPAAPAAMGRTHENKTAGASASASGKPMKESDRIFYERFGFAPGA
jgi:hypothetical protein